MSHKHRCLLLFASGLLSVSPVKYQRPSEERGIIHSGICVFMFCENTLIFLLCVMILKVLECHTMLRAGPATAAITQHTKSAVFMVTLV